MQINENGTAAIHHYDPSTNKWPGDFIALKGDLNTIFLWIPKKW